MLTKKKFFLIIMGSALEYYDFVLYGLLATYISKNFFPESVKSLHLLQNFSIFALGYLIRPLGGTILGIIADRYSRIRVFAFSILLMGISTLAIGLLPSYEKIGILSPLLLVLARLLQGISFAAELPGALTILSEDNFKNRVSASIGKLMASTNFGFLAASLIIYLIHLSLTPEQVLVWGWRIPFIIGGILAFVSYYVRREFCLTYEIETLPKNSNKPHLKAFLSDIFSTSKVHLLIGISVTTMIASGTIFFIYLPHFLQEYFLVQPKDISLCFSIGLAVFMIACLQFGKIMQTLNVRKFFLGAALTFPAVVYLLISYVQSSLTFFSLFILFFLYEVYMAALFTGGLIILPQLFPSHSRTTCVSFCYNLSFSICSLIPVILTYFISATKQIEVVTMLFSGLSLIVLVNCLSQKVRNLA